MEQLKDTLLYFHIVKNQIIYVGIGGNKRPYDKGILRTKEWNEITKDGYEIDIWKTKLTWKDACNYEIEWIAKIGRKDKGLGPLVNKTNGGEGSKGHIDSQEVKDRRNKSISALGPRSKETKEKLRLKMLGKKNAKGYKLTEEQRKKVSKAQIGNKKRLGKLHTKETKEKMSKSHIGKSMFGKKHSAETKAKMAEKRRQYYLNKN